MAETFKPEHFWQMNLQRAQVPERKIMTLERLQMLAGGPSVTFRDERGEIVACLGAVECDEGCIVWAFLSRSAGRHGSALFKAARRMMGVIPRPTYAVAACGFSAGKRLLRMLGFQKLKPADAPFDLEALGQVAYVRMA